MTQSDSNLIGTLVAAALMLATVTLMGVTFKTARAAGALAAFKSESATVARSDAAVTLGYLRVSTPIRL